jgi:glycosyltransferase involved in cell wall biosynthesis
VSRQRGPIGILELRSVWGTGGGPEKTILLGAAQSDPARFRVTVCYIRDERDPVFGIDRRAEGAGVHYVEVRERHSLDWRVVPALRQLVREHRIDIVHAHEYKTDLLALVMSRTDGIVPLATVHGWTGHSRREQLYYFVDKRLLARFPRLIAVSSEIRQQLLATGTPAGRVSVVLNGIDHRAFARDPARVAGARAALGFESDATIAGAVGRLEPQKRFDLLLQAIGRLRPAFPRLRCVIAGDGSLRSELERQIKDLGLDGVCRLLGHCGDVGAVHHGIDLFVQSSKYEGTPNAVLEAMAFASPVVATAVGGTAELVENGRDGLIVSPNDIEALTEGIRTVLERPDLARQWALAARRRVETDLSFEHRMRSVEAVYEELAMLRPGNVAEVA